VLILLLCTVLPLWPAEPPPAPDRLLEEGLRLQSEGRETEALERLRRAYDLDPDSAEVAFRLGVLLGRAGYLREARERLAAAARLAPERPEVHLESGRVLAKMLDRDGALAAFEKTLSLDPAERTRYTAMIGRGKVYAESGRLDRAADSLEAVLAENPRSPAALAYLGLVRRKRGDFDGALEVWRRYLELRPRNGWVGNWAREAEEARASIESARQRLRAAEREDPADWVLIGELLLDAGDVKGSLKAMKKALQAGAGNELLRFRAEILQGRERWSEADRDLEVYLEDHPEDRTAQYRLALGRLQMGDCRGAAATWRRLDARSEDDPFPYRMVLRSLQCPDGAAEEIGNRLQAEAATLLESIEAGPDEPGKHLRLALVREQQGRILDSFDRLRPALRFDPHHPYYLQEFRRLATEHPDAALEFASRLKERLLSPPVETLDLLMFAYIAWLNGDTETAERLFLAGRRLDPDNPDVHIAHAHVLSMLGGKPDEALEVLRAAAERAPESRTVLLSLGLLELERRQIREAIATGEKLLVIDPDSYHALGLLGSAEAIAGRHRQAIGYLLGALRADPTDPEGTVRFQLAVSLAAAGKVREARWVLRSDLPWRPQNIYERSWRLVREYYVDRDFSGHDWDSWRNRFDGRLESRDDAYRAVVEMLAALGDRYTRLRPPEETAVLFLNPRSEGIDLDDQGRPLPTSRSVVSEDLAEGIRYIRLTNLTDPALVELMRRSLAETDGKKGVILDLRGNPGGVQGESEVVGSLFLEEGATLGEIVDRWGRRRIEAGGEDPIDPDVPVIVLVDENTGSAAESLAGALRESGRARVVGTQTRGKGASQVSLLLPGGAMVMVTAARNVTPAGGEIEGVGIRPDVPVPESDQGPEDAFIEKAKELLKEEEDTGGEEE
jgi:C-terminal processing protease CtpA/Prc/cytochrome c-type biogenesis protein CcmH/NrfG